MSFKRLVGFFVGLAAVAVFVPAVVPGLLAAFLAPPAEVVSPPGVDDVRRMALYADPRGHFQVDTVINGRSVSMMVDTGATVVALNADTAHRLGIAPPDGAYTVPLSTANGVIMSARVTLSEIRIGGIIVRNVDAAIVPGDLLPINLLGMNFLSRLSRFEVAGGQLVLVE